MKTACRFLLSSAVLGLALPTATMANTATLAEMESGQAPIIVNGQREGYAIDDVDATKTGTPLLDTPQSVTTIGREQLNDQAVEALNDALRYVPGVVLGQGEGHRDQIVLRGQSSTADFFLDGLRDDAQYYRPLFNTERVEVLKGANALLFGRGGGGGIINRVSKSAGFEADAVGLSGGVDTFGAWSVAADANLVMNDTLALRLNGTYEELANHRDVYEGEFIGVAPTLGARLGEATTLTLAYEYDRDDRVIERGIPSLGGNPIRGYDETFFGTAEVNQGTVDAHIARARIDHELADGLTLSVAGLFASYDKLYANILPSSATATTVTLSGYESGSKRINWIGQANLVWKGETAGIGHTLLAGIEGGSQISESTRRNVLFTTAAGGTAASATVPLAQSLTIPGTSWTGLVTNARSSVATLSAYFQDQVELTDYLQVIAGVRYDRFEIDAFNRLTALATTRQDGKWSPRFGVVVKPQANLSLYASYAKSFLPQTGDQFSTLDAAYQTLDPEAFRNLEFGIKWDAAPGLALTAAAFQVDRSNTRVADPANPGYFVLTGASRVKGLEAALSGRILPSWSATLAYTYQEGEIRSATSAAPAGRQLDKLPRHQASAWTRYDVSDRLGLGLGVVHQSSQYATISNAVTLPAFTRLDAAVYYDVSERFAVQLNVENLTDTRYYPSAHTDNNIATGEPINARITARVKF
ncbi:catecholate siderophore receptor [Novosphingobium kunmingense]|uniref:Catecholate siderophore receptor n=1 Tax=Novosphingobium kunmingense TaxID=1211806 RepID=A0A2N0H727_9SPHN|nr:TonB-dependent siderophore receptor [Novosphingobium kunmingense]PKB14741.1 catecholate siderophore receptor [Novosphingobium kunmingense]